MPERLVDDECELRALAIEDPSERFERTIYFVLIMSFYSLGPWRRTPSTPRSWWRPARAMFWLLTVGTGSEILTNKIFFF